MNDFVKKVSKKISKLSPEQLERFIYSVNAENDALDSIMESLSSGLLIVDGNFYCFKFNKAAERHLPFKVRLSEQKENTRIWDIIDDDNISSFLKSCASERKTNVSEEFSFTKDDKVHFVTVGIVPLVQKVWNEEGDAFDTNISGSIITVEDITDKRQQEVLLHRMESLAGLTNLAASVAHEIKNPLGAISIHIQLLQKAIKKARSGDGQLPAPKFMENYLSVITEEIDNLNKIVVDFLFAVRPVQANFVLTEPDSLIRKFISFFKPEFSEKHVAV